MTFHLDQIGTLVVLALAVSAIAMTLTKTAIFRPPRSWVARKSEFWGELVTCPYCTSHWVAVALAVAVPARPVQTGWWILDFGIATSALVTLSAVGCGMIYKAFADMGEEEFEEE